MFVRLRCAGIQNAVPTVPKNSFARLTAVGSETGQMLFPHGSKLHTITELPGLLVEIEQVAFIAAAGIQLMTAVFEGL
jgi:hypothetical protein